MKNKLLQLAKEKHFESVVIGRSVESKYSNKDFYYLWMCELQKWLREKYNIDIWMNDWDDKYGMHITINKNNPDLIKSFMFNYPIGTYEEALEAGLYEALLLL